MKAPDEIDAYVGERVRARRQAIGMSREQLGSRLGLTFQQIQKYERGRNRIGAGRLYRIATILSVPVAHFYEGLPAGGTAHDALAAARDETELLAFLHSEQGRRLIEAFRRIEDQATRRRILDLVTTIASDAEGGDGAEDTDRASGF